MLFHRRKKDKEQSRKRYLTKSDKSMKKGIKSQRLRRPRREGEKIKVSTSLHVSFNKERKKGGNPQEFNMEIVGKTKGGGGRKRSLLARVGRTGAGDTATVFGNGKRCLVCLNSLLGPKKRQKAKGK